MTNEELALSVVEHGNRIKVSEHRIDDLEKKTDKLESLTLSVQKLALSVEQMAHTQEEYRAEQKSLADRILNVENQPAKDKAGKYDKYIGQIVTLFVGGIVGFLLKSLFGI